MIALALAAALAATPQQFDLVCSGSETNQYLQKDHPDDRQPWSKRYTIDLDAKVYVSDGKLFDIQSITSTLITFYDDPSPAFPVRRAAVRRTSGDYSGALGSTYAIHEQTGTCQVAPFSGLPSRRF